MCSMRPAHEAARPAHPALLQTCNHQGGTTTDAELASAKQSVARVQVLAEGEAEHWLRAAQDLGAEASHLSAINSL